MHRIKAFYSDSTCLTQLFRLYEWGTDWGIGEAISGAATGVQKLNFTASTEVNISSADGATAANALTYCGKSDWTASEWRSVSGLVCEGRTIPAANAKHYAGIKFSGNTIELEATHSGSNDGTTVAKRNPLVDGLVLTKSSF
jgi:hypothetical protein